MIDFLKTLCCLDSENRVLELQSKFLEKSFEMSKLVLSKASPSLWNCALSPGWTSEEVAVLRQAVLKFGVGNWFEIVESGCLPGKTIAQINNQTQRMLGQQSTAEFANLHIDVLVIGERNSKLSGPEIKRKAGLIINTGGCFFCFFNEKLKSNTNQFIK